MWDARHLLSDQRGPLAGNEDGDDGGIDDVLDLNLDDIHDDDVHGQVCMSSASCDPCTHLHQLLRA